jgi:hypothetical protein
MSEDEQDQITSEKILEAAEQIKDMARNRPTEAAEMLERAKYLAELAEQIRRDWLQRCGDATPDRGANASRRLRAGEPETLLRPDRAWLIAEPQAVLKD